MPRRSQPKDPELLRQQAIQLLTNFAEDITKDDLRQRVIALIPAFHTLRDLGSSMVPKAEADSGLNRLLLYLQRYPQRVIDGDELMVVSGIQDWPRRVRELRKQEGWWIYSGATFRSIAEDAKDTGEIADASAVQQMLGVDPSRIKDDQYVLMRTDQDLEAAHRWHILNKLRRSKLKPADRIIHYMRQNIGRPIPGEELQYLTPGKKEWARRVRELRTEDGWSIVTRNTGRKALPVGVYLLENDQQAEPHDRRIKDGVRVAVLTRDGFSCTECGWNHEMQTVPGDPRTALELHHKILHKNKGQNTAENLITLCNVHHKTLHAVLYKQ